MGGSLLNCRRNVRWTETTDSRFTNCSTQKALCSGVAIIAVLRHRPKEKRGEGLRMSRKLWTPAVSFHVGKRTSAGVFKAVMADWNSSNHFDTLCIKINIILYYSSFYRSVLSWWRLCSAETCSWFVQRSVCVYAVIVHLFLSRYVCIIGRQRRCLAYRKVPFRPLYKVRSPTHSATFWVFLRNKIFVVGPGSSGGIPTRYRLDGPGIESLWGMARFSAPVQTGPAAHPASCTMGTGSFPGIKRPGRGADHPPLSKCRGQVRVGLYLYSPSGPSWPVMRAPLPLPLQNIRKKLKNY